MQSRSSRDRPRRSYLSLSIVTCALAVDNLKFVYQELLEVKGKGVAAIKTISGIKLLENVLYVPEIEHNLLSVGQLVDAGFSVHFEDGLCVVKNSNDVDLLTIA